MSRRPLLDPHVRRVITAAVVVGAAAITLGPTQGSLLRAVHDAAVSITGTLVPGVTARPREHEVEGVLNVVVPAVLVVLLAWSFPGAARLRIALLTAVAWWSVEVAQLAIPGRHPRLRDVALNTTGVAVGLACVGVAEWWSHRRGASDRSGTVGSVSPSQRPGRS